MPSNSATEGDMTPEQVKASQYAAMRNTPPFPIPPRNPNHQGVPMGVPGFPSSTGMTGPTGPRDMTNSARARYRPIRVSVMPRLESEEEEEAMTASVVHYEGSIQEIAMAKMEAVATPANVASEGKAGVAPVDSVAKTVVPGTTFVDSDSEAEKGAPARAEAVVKPEVADRTELEITTDKIAVDGDCKGKTKMEITPDALALPGGGSATSVYSGSVKPSPLPDTLGKKSVEAGVNGSAKDSVKDSAKGSIDGSMETHKEAAIEVAPCEIAPGEIATGAVDHANVVADAKRTKDTADVKRAEEAVETKPAAEGAVVRVTAPAHRSTEAFPDLPECIAGPTYPESPDSIVGPQSAMMAAAVEAWQQAIELPAAVPFLVARPRMKLRHRIKAKFVRAYKKVFKKKN